jgi:hypothetical protein
MDPVSITTLSYESPSPEAPAPRPKWVYGIAALYGLLIIGLISAAVIPLAIDREDGLLIPLVISVSLLVIAQVGLIYVPVRVASRRPFTRRSLWWPLIGSGFMAGVLVLGGGIAWGEWLTSDARIFLLVIASAAVTWLAWTIIFWRMSATTNPASIASSFHRWLLAGSVLELLIAVPTHLVVRRRTECCAGVFTMMGICMGVAVMLLAFGPSVGFLYYKRWKQVRRPVETVTP